MKDAQGMANGLERLDCGCYRYCQEHTSSRPRDADLMEFSQNLINFLGEGWYDWARWEATEFSAAELPR